MTNQPYSVGTKTRYGVVVTNRRGAWWGAAALLLAAALAAAGAVHLHWLPCRGSMLSGSLLHGYAYGPDFSDACLQTMDDGFSFLYPPGADERWEAESVCGVLAAVLAGAAWLLVVLTARWSQATTLVAALPALATWGGAVFSLAAAGVASGTEARAHDILLLAPNVLAVVAFGVIALRESLAGEVLLRVALLLGGTTAFGLVQTVADYAFMVSTSDANWDTPPGAGYPTVASIVLAAAAVAVLAQRRGPRAAERSLGALSRAAGTPVG